VRSSSQPESTLDTLEELAAFLPVLSLSPEASGEYGGLRAALEAKGKPIGNNDLWIAAQAKAAGLILLTNSEREFKRIKGLAVENWTR
jgi:tRNA(fMet)-specific endonuclease VapC